MEIVIEVASAYARSEKGWKTAGFHVDVKRRQDDQTIVANVVYEHGLKGLRKGGGKSVELWVNIESKKVTRELGFQ